MDPKVGLSTPYEDLDSPPAPAVPGLGSFVPLDERAIAPDPVLVAVPGRVRFPFAAFALPGRCWSSGNKLLNDGAIFIPRSSDGPMSLMVLESLTNLMF